MHFTVRSRWRRERAPCRKAEKMMMSARTTGARTVARAEEKACRLGWRCATLFEVRPGWRGGLATTNHCMHGTRRRSSVRMERQLLRPRDAERYVGYQLKPQGFHEGDRSEYLGQFALSTVGHWVPVPRQADHFGVDLYLQLFDEDGRNLRTTGMGCAFQLKSTNDDIHVDSTEKVMALQGLAYPLFIGVIDKSSGTITIFSTILRTAFLGSALMIR